MEFRRGLIAAATRKSALPSPSFRRKPESIALQHGALWIPACAGMTGLRCPGRARPLHQEALRPISSEVSSSPPVSIRRSIQTSFHPGARR
jgi:hypothetical protein